MIQNKQEFIEQFIAQYWGQKIVKVDCKDYLITALDYYFIAPKPRIEYIQLKDIANISDEDFQQVMKNTTGAYDKSDLLDVYKNDFNSPPIWSHESDMLRKLKYAIAFQGYSVQEMINQGIPIKLV